MGLTLNSSITELILEIGNLLNSSENNTRTFALEIPNQSFFLEITVKPKKEEVKEINPYRMNKKMETEIFNLYEHMRNYYEIIGNVYENPELLEVTE
ncbi:YopX family protein [Streptococcus parasanguinis]|uniref:YopX family protein n=1 Tax=Streptococcus parasanguinis TaxID=1318 RepID=UPI001BE723C0|nr:YopX family protein [Streptococcus parasanguinis]MBT3138399.1 YopX family protein [Streptococcus parasanguinis]